MNDVTAGPILTTDGIPLKVSLQKSERRNKIRALLLVAPLLIFILITFLIPIGDMLLRSVDDSYINTVFPKTFEKYKKWDRQGLPSEELYKTMFFEVKEGSGFSIGKATTRMNYADEFREKFNITALQYNKKADEQSWVSMLKFFERIFK